MGYVVLTTQLLFYRMLCYFNSTPSSVAAKVIAEFGIWNVQKEIKVFISLLWGEKDRNFRPTRCNSSLNSDHCTL